MTYDLRPAVIKPWMTLKVQVDSSVELARLNSFLFGEFQRVLFFIKAKLRFLPLTKWYLPLTKCLPLTKW